MVSTRIPRMGRRLTLSVLAILLMSTSSLTADDSNEAWAALVKGGHVAVIRHGNAPPGYGGDPPGFRFDDCKTQRNLDDAGREAVEVEAQLAQESRALESWLQSSTDNRQRLAKCVGGGV